ncbi:MAG: tRNA uridine-5-carboxymethylaminomethyl(34) synthesis enzyme MnmG [Clostridiales bacterium]|nr:tRNA uridine-5-carboxymethylaminomethyl(34) synthesis enzyme MnmG [Clostridiales bacterium]
MDYFIESYDVAVIGAGHAGIEAGLAAARLGCKTCVFTINLDWVGNMACNPSIGGTSKGHLVREIDALGGEIGKAADANTLQSRMLNLGKGPAVHSLRAQIDRRRYTEHMKYMLERQSGLDLRQAEIVDVSRGEKGEWVLKTNIGAIYNAVCVVLATGTFLAAKVFVGESSYDSGPDGMFPSTELAASLRRLGVQMQRFKTGTPSRINRNSVDFSKVEQQDGDKKVSSFSFNNDSKIENKVSCYITYTNEKTKKIILKNLHRSPLYGGKIEGIGPRYCPSIEDKVVRFAEKDRHQVFIEPCGEKTEELYLQGLSTSLPEDVQLEFMRTVPGLENCRVTRTAYAIEYDCVNALTLSHSLEFHDFEGLFGAGQFNGSSGYEEAAAQGLVAGINAAHKVLGKSAFVLDRAGSYIGTLIDDLVTKGCSEPYRMMTSRSEYRLLLRQDNADRRLMKYGHELGLISKERYEEFLCKLDRIEQESRRIERTVLTPTEELNKMLVSRGTSPIVTGARLVELMRRPQLNYELLSPFDKDRPDLPEEIFEQVEIETKYEGYIKRQKAQVDEMRRLERRALPKDIDFGKISGIRLEAAEKLSKVRPENVGQASRISGVSPADISVLMIYIDKLHRAGMKTEDGSR